MWYGAPNICMKAISNMAKKKLRQVTDSGLIGWLQFLQITTNWKTCCSYSGAFNVVKMIWQKLT